MPLFWHFENSKICFKKGQKKEKRTYTTRFKNKDLKKGLLLLLMVILPVFFVVIEMLLLKKLKTKIVYFKKTWSKVYIEIVTRKLIILSSPLKLKKIKKTSVILNNLFVSNYY